MNTSRTITSAGSTPSSSHSNSPTNTAQVALIGEASAPGAASDINPPASEPPTSITDQDKFLGKTMDVPAPIIGLGRFFDRSVRHEFVSAVNELQVDATKVGRQHCPNVATWGEALVKSGWAVGANRGLRKAYPKIKATVSAMASIETAQKQRVTQLQQWPDTALVGPEGECMTITAAETAHHLALTTVQDDRANKSLRHETISGGLKKLIKSFTLIDLVVIYLFLSNVLNVNVNNPMKTLIPFITAVFLSLLGTAAYGVGLHWIGVNLRHWKNADRWLDLPASRSARRLPAAMLTAMITLPILVGVLMTYRIWHDSSEAAAPLAGGAITAVFMAVMVCVLGLMVGFSAFLDGSRETDTIHHLAPQIALARESRKTVLSAIISAADKVQQLRDDVDTAVLEAIVEASDKISGADQVIMAARSYLQTTGPIALTLTDTADRTDVVGFLEPLVYTELRDMRAAQLRAHAIAHRTAASASSARILTNPSQGTATAEIHEDSSEVEATVGAGNAGPTQPETGRDEIAA